MTADEIKERMKIAFGNGGLEHMVKGVRSGGWPIGQDGNMISWSDWLALRFEAAGDLIEKQQ